MLHAQIISDHLNMNDLESVDAKTLKDLADKCQIKLPNNSTKVSMHKWQFLYQLRFRCSVNVLTHFIHFNRHSSLLNYFPCMERCFMEPPPAIVLAKLSVTQVVFTTLFVDMGYV